MNGRCLTENHGLALLLSLLLVFTINACGGGSSNSTDSAAGNNLVDDGSNTNPSADQTTTENSGAGDATGLLSARVFVEGIESLFGNEDTAIDAFLLALDNGYSLKRIADAVINTANTLTSNGFIVDNSGNTITATAVLLSDLQVLRDPNSPLFRVLFTASVTDLREFAKNRAARLRDSMEQHEIDTLETRISRLNAIGMLVTLIQEGYTAEQIEEAFLFGYTVTEDFGTIGLGVEISFVGLRDETGKLILPDHPQQEPAFSEFAEDQQDTISQPDATTEIVPLEVTCCNGPNSIEADGVAEYTFDINGGVSPYSIATDWDDGFQSRGGVDDVDTPRISHIYRFSGTKIIGITITDAVGTSVSTTITLEVEDPAQDTPPVTIPDEPQEDPVEAPVPDNDPDPVTTEPLVNMAAFNIVDECRASVLMYDQDIEFVLSNPKRELRGLFEFRDREERISYICSSELIDTDSVCGIHIVIDGTTFAASDQMRDDIRRNCPL